MNKLHLFWILGGVVFGLLAGFGYWFLIGCNTGQCIITSVWYNSSAYGALLGGLLGSVMFGFVEGQSKEPENRDDS